MSVSNERLQELAELIAALKKKVLFIDNKYSTDYVEPQLNLPDSLNLEHLTFTPKTDAELTAIAEQQVAASYLAKKRAIDASYASGTATNDKSQSQLVATHEEKLAKLLTDYTDGWKSTYRRLVNNGLLFSSVVTTAQQRALDEYNAAVTEENNAYQTDLTALTNAKTALTNKYNAQISSLDSEKAANIATALEELKTKQNKEKLAIDKYNTSLDEREVKYQASKARTEEYARQAEYDRALQASKLTVELGETGLIEQKQSEKFTCCKFELVGLTKEEALIVVDSDSFFSEHLGSKFTTLKAWINDNLA